MKNLQTLSFGLALLASSCTKYDQEDFDALALSPQDVIIHLTSDRSEVLANNVDIVTVAAELPDGSDEGVSVVFTTDHGVFVPGAAATVTVQSKVVLQNGQRKVMATAVLRNGITAGTINVKAGVGEYERTLEITSTNNPPTALDMSTASLTLSNDVSAEVQLTVQLVAGSGSPSLGQLVSMSVWDAAYSSELGNFRVTQNLSDEQGKCRFTYGLVPDNTYTGALHAVANFQLGSLAISDTLTFYAID